MMKKDITVYVNSKTSMVDLHSSRLGISGENLQGNLIVKFDDEFVNGNAILEIQRNDEKYYLVMQKENESYYLPILSSLLSETTTIIMQIRITEGTDNESIPVWKSNKFYLKVEEAINAEIPIPEEYDEWIDIANAKLNELDNIDIDVEKIGNTSTVTITKKDGQQETVQILDGEKGDTGEKGEKGDTGSIGPQGPQGPQGIQGPMGPQGKAFTISKTYSSVSEMNADFDNMQVGDYVMIASSVELEDNAKLYVKGEEEWLFVSDFSGAMGIQGEQGIQGIQGIQGEQGIQGIQGETGNGIATIQKTSTSGLIDTYTITYTDGNMSTFSITNGKDGKDGEVSQEQLDETNSHLDHLSKVSNLFEKITGTGTSVTLNDTSNTIMKLNLDTTTSSQATTTGKNLFNGVAWQKCILNTGLPVNIGTGSTIINSSNANNVIFTTTDNSNGVISAPINVNAGQNYILSLTLANTLNTVRLNILKYSNESYSIIGEQNVNQTDGNKQYSISVPSDTNQIVLLISGTTSNLTNCSAINIQLENGTTATTYEPYTGGQPAPSPSYPQTIHTISGNNDIKINNKNLYNMQSATPNSSTSYTINNNNSIRVYNTSASWRSAYTELTVPAGNYAFSFQSIVVSGAKQVIIQKVIDGTATDFKTMTITNETTFTLDSETLLRFVFFSTTGTNTAGDVTYSNIQLENNTSVTSYEPYKQQTYSVNLGDIELCKIGNYEDILFKNTINNKYYNSSLELNKWYKISNVGKIIYDGSQGWASGQNSRGITYFYKNLTDKINGGTVFCNLFTQRSSLWTLDEYTDCIVTEANNKIVSIMLSDSTITTPQLFGTWLSTHNTIVYYPLATPTYTLLNDTLQTQLDNIQYALAYDTQTNISQTNNDLPFIINAETYKEINLTDYVKNTDYASSSTGGVIKTGNYFQVNSSGQTYADTINYSAYQSVSNATFISKGTLENVITGKGLIDSSYHDSTKQDVIDNTLTTINKTIPTAINEVNSIAKGANQALSYGNYSTMIGTFNNLANNVYNTGQNVMIVTLQVPDLWISGIESTSQTYTYTTDEAFTTELSTNGYIQVGYYKLSALETQKVDLTDYVKNTDYASSSTGGVIKTNTVYGSDVSAYGTLKGVALTYSNYGSSSNDLIISKGTLENVITGKGLVTNQDISGKANKISVVQTSASTIEINPNTFYKFGEVASLNITLASITDNTIYNEYMFEFVSGSTATTLTLPSSIKWLETPTIDANKIYQCSIVDNVGLLVGVTNV